MRRIGWSAFLVLSLAVGGAACGDDDESGDEDLTDLESDEGGGDEGGGDEGADGDVEEFCDAVDEYAEAIENFDPDSAEELSTQAQELSAQAQELIPTLDAEGAERVGECTSQLSTAVPGG